MMSDTLSQLAQPALIAVASTVALALLRGILLRIAGRWAGRAETRIDDIVIESVKTPSHFWCVAIGLYPGVILSDLPQKYVHHLGTVISVIVIVSVTITLANLAGRVFKHYLQQSQLPIPSTGLAYGILKGTILIGFLIVLNFLGISPLLTALGVGGLAVALALQDTLSNLFAGLHILRERSIRVGDSIRLESGQEGYVEDTTWRTTRVRTVHIREVKT